MAAYVSLLLLALLAGAQLVHSHSHHGAHPARAIPDRPGVAARFNYPAAQGGARRIVGAERLGRIRKKNNVRASVGEIASLLTNAPDLGLDEGTDRLVYRCQGLTVDEPAAQAMEANEAAEAAAAAAAASAAAASDELVSAASASGTALSEVASGVAVSVSDPALGVLTRDQVFALSSRPGAVKKIYLDFDGHVTTGTRWNEAWRKGSIVTPPYNIDGNANAFSFQEVQDIFTIWRGVAEDFAMMDVDVTTVPPESGYGANVANYIRVVIGGAAADWVGGSAGGIAYLNSFGDAVYGPAFVFQSDLRSKPKAIWEAASHEVGHTLGLLHDGVSGVTEYYGGSDNSNYAPIMGVGYYKSITQWSKGEYPGANNKQDDLAVMAAHPNGPRMLASTFGSSAATATPLPPPPAGTARGAPQSRSISGVISASGAVDVFSFYADAGPFSFNAVGVATSPAGAARTNVDLQVTLTDVVGAVIASSNDPASMSASGSGSLPASGAYFLSVTGTGLGDPATGGYTNYGSLGQYSITLNFVAFPQNAGRTELPGTPSPEPVPSPVLPQPSPVVPQPSPAPLPSPSPSPAPLPSPAPSPVPSPVPSPPPAIPTIKVATFSIRRVNSGGSLRCVANIRLVDGTGAPVPFAGIQGTWRGNTAGAATTPFTVTSESNGAFGTSSPAMPRAAGIGNGCTYTITGTTKAGFVLAASTSYGMTGTLTW